jgi:hypothetical protein
VAALYLRHGSYRGSHGTGNQHASDVHRSNRVGPLARTERAAQTDAFVAEAISRTPVTGSAAPVAYDNRPLAKLADQSRPAFRSPQVANQHKQ